MADPSYPAYPIFAFLSVILVLIPFPWHLQAWNSGTCLYMFWVAIACLNQFVNSIVWHDTAVNFAPVWCDISSRIMIGTAVAIPAASLCINRRLYKIAAASSSVSMTRQEKVNSVIVDLCIGLGIPLIEMVLQYVVQGHRFDIYEDFGCFPFTYNVWPAYPLVVLWPMIIGLVSAVYCLLTLKAFLQRRAEFSKLLSTHSSLTPNRYFRLMALASADLLCTVPFNIYGLYLNISEGVQPWISWEDVHWGFSNVKLYPAVLWRSNPTVRTTMELDRWLLVVCAIVFFAFFGFAQEACNGYKKMWASFCDRVTFLRCFRTKSRAAAAPILPTRDAKPCKHDSLYILDKMPEDRSSLSSSSRTTSSIDDKTYLTQMSPSTIRRSDFSDTSSTALVGSESPDSFASRPFSGFLRSPSQLERTPGQHSSLMGSRYGAHDMA